MTAKIARITGLSKSLLLKSWPYLAIISAHLIWGVNFVVAKVTLQEIPPMSLAFLRFIIASILIIPFLAVERKKIKLKLSGLPRLFAVGSLMAALNIAFFYAGLSKTTVTQASALTMIIPIASVLAGWWFLKEKVYVVNLIGVAFGLLGAALIIGLPLIALGVAGNFFPTLIGNFLIILASLAWVAGAILSKKILKEYSTLTVTAAAFFVGSLAFAVPTINEYLQNPVWPSQLTLLGVLGLLYIAILSSISAYFLFEWGLSKLGVVKADLFQYIEPLVATSLGVLLLNEQIRFSFIAGAILVGLGVYWGTLGKPEHKHPKYHRT